MKYEMATLYSSFAARRHAVALPFGRRCVEWADRIKGVFYDVFRHFHGAGVADRRHSVVASIAVAAGVLAGCAGVGGLAADAPAEVKREAVAARATARWERLIGRDVEGAYAFLSPASRATMPLDVYKAKHKVGMYRSVKVDNVDCEAETCTVKLSLTYDYRVGKGSRKPTTITTPLTEKWIISQGQAWFVDRG